MTRQEKLAGYDAFVEKFKPKKTTDDCYTQESIFAVVQDYVSQRWGVDPARMVRPFWPGGDYETYDYAEDAVVVDNPPFSILAKIVDFYIANQIPYFLFGPALTIIGVAPMDANHLCCGCPIVYANGAEVCTAFITSFGLPTVAETAPDLYAAVKHETDRLRKQNTKTLATFQFPPAVATAAMLQRYSHYGVDYRIERADAEFCRALASMKTKGKAIFGGGYLLSHEATQAKEAAEHQALEAKEHAEREARGDAYTWQLSEQEEAVRALLSARRKGRQNGAAH